MFDRAAYIGRQREYGMRLKSLFPGVLLLALLISLLSGCGSSSTGELDTEAMTSALLSSGAFSDLLNPVDAKIAGLLYGYAAGDVSSVSVYCGTGATAEEIAVFKAVDPAAAKRLKEAAERRVTDQKKAFADYAPGEIPKLDHADIREKGLFVVMVVSADEKKTGDILNQYI
jgi:hypothetical protein